MAFIQPEKPTQSAFIESFNGRLRDEPLNGEVFDGLCHAKAKLAVWQHEYDNVRRHSSLGGLTPAACRASELYGGSAPGTLAKTSHPECQPAGFSF